MRARFSAIVGGQQRSNEKHRSASRPHDAGKCGAQRQQRGIAHRRRAELSAQTNATGNREQCEQDDDERQVLGNQHMRDFMYCRTESEGVRERNQQDKRPRYGDLAVMSVPELACDEWKDGDREEQTGKGNTPLQRQNGAVQRWQRPINGSSHVAAESQTSSGNSACFSVAELVEDRLDPRGVCKECVHATWIEMAAALSLQEFDTFLERPCFFVRAFRNERVEYVSDGDYAGNQRNVFGVQAVG